MKKSMVSLSAALALGGLGFAGTAHAWVAFQPYVTSSSPDDLVDPAILLVRNASGTGHMLFTPYYTANDGLATLVNIVNVDPANGKAVKVRFRGASNSDDVLDFTLFLSPGDVWSGAVLQDAATGKAMLSTNDKSCTIPAAKAGDGSANWPVAFKTQRLPGYVGEGTQAALTREGYVEVLNMANIRPGSDLYEATKHVDGVAPCGTLDYDNLLSTSTDVSAAMSYGLDFPTGQLMGSWSILNLGDMGVYSGKQTAIVGTNPESIFGLFSILGGAFPNATANLAFFPQIDTPAGDVTAYTADPLLAGTSPIIEPLWFDLPDMSTPLVPMGLFTGPVSSPTGQAINLSLTLASASIANEYIATAPGAAVPMATDWVVSQPTRRYHAAVDYADSAANSALVFADTSSLSSPVGNIYRDLTLDQTNAFGPQACIKLSFSSTDREEKLVKQISGGSFSPGSPPTVLPYCGEVFVAQFSGTSPLHANITKRAVTPVGDAGWASLSYSGINFGTGGSGGDDPSSAFSVGLPMVGYAATLFQNAAAGTTYGQTFPHSWIGPTLPGVP